MILEVILSINIFNRQKKMVRLILLLIAMIVSVSTFSWPLIEDGKKTYLTANLKNKDGFIETYLELKPKSPTTALNLLSTYYSAAVINNVAKIQQLYNIEDGSRHRFIKEIQAIPDKYSGFHKVDKILVKDIVNWGDYSAVIVEWYSKGKKLANFVELVTCENLCTLSDRLQHTTPQFSIFKTVVFSYLKNLAKPNRSNVISGKKVNFYPPSGVQSNPVSLTYDFSIYKRKSIFDKKGVREIDVNNKAIKSVTDFIELAWQQGPSTLSRLSEKGIDHKSIITSLFKSHWHSFDIKEMLLLHDKSTGNPTYYTPVSLLQNIVKWKRIEFVGYMKSKKSTLLLVSATYSDNSTEFQILPLVESNGEYLLTARSRDAQSIRLLLSGNIIKSIEAHYK